MQNHALFLPDMTAFTLRNFLLCALQRNAGFGFRHASGYDDIQSRRR